MARCGDVAPMVVSVLVKRKERRKRKKINNWKRKERKKIKRNTNEKEGGRRAKRVCVRS
jgi:hypothetical protein